MANSERTAMNAPAMKAIFLLKIIRNDNQPHILPTAVTLKVLSLLRKNGEGWCVENAHVFSGRTIGP